MPRRAASPIIACALGCLLGLASVAPARAETFTVTSTADAGASTLREAVDMANASGDVANTIVFTLPDPSTIVLLSPLPTLDNGALTLDGTGSPGLLIDGGAQDFLSNGGSSTALTLRSVDYTNGSISLLINQLTFDEAGTGAIDGEVSATSTPFVKTGVGDTTLNAGHTIDVVGFGFSETRIEEGTFIVNGDFLGNALSVAEAANLQIGGTGSFSATGVTDGGAIDVDPGGQLTASTLLVLETGTVDVGGTVTVTSSLSDRGTITVEPGGTLTADTLTVDSTGTLDVTGSVFATSFTDQGTVSVNPGGQITASALTVGPSGSLTVDGIVDVTGGTVTDQGNLVVNQTLIADSLIIASQGVLSGNTGAAMGVFAPVTVRGRIAPSTSSGTLHITGPVSFEADSGLEVEILPGDVGDRLVVQGGNAVTIQPGARLDIVADPTAFATPSTVTVLTADGGINGQFIATDYAVLEETLDYQANALTVTLTNTGFTGAALTPNQTAVARALDAADGNATADLQSVLTTLNTALAGEFPALLDAIGGEPLTAFATARQILGERTSRALHRRTRDAAWGEGNAFYASRVDVRAPAAPVRLADSGGMRVAGANPLAATRDVAAPSHSIHRDRVRAGAWLDGFGVIGDLEGGSGEADVETILYGGTLGVDVWLAERVLLGLAAGYARSDIDADGRDTDLAGDTIQGALYAGWTDPRGFVSGYGRYAYSFQDSTRAIQSSQVSRNARARFDAQDYGAGAEAGVTVLSFGTFALQPIAGIDWLRLTEESYTEKSAGGLGLDVDPDDLESVTGRFGARIFGHIDMDGAGELVPELRAFWQREFGDTDRVLDARLSGAPGLPAIGVRGPEMPRDVILLGIGWSASVSEQLQILLDYDALLDADRVEHQGNLAVRVRF